VPCTPVVRLVIGTPGISRLQTRIFSGRTATPDRHPFGAGDAVADVVAAIDALDDHVVGEVAASGFAFPSCHVADEVGDEACRRRLVDCRSARRPAGMLPSLITAMREGHRHRFFPGRA